MLFLSPGTLTRHLQIFYFKHWKLNLNPAGNWHDGCTKQGNQHKNVPKCPKYWQHDARKSCDRMIYVAWEIQRCSRWSGAKSHARKDCYDVVGLGVTQQFWMAHLYAYSTHVLKTTSGTHNASMIGPVFMEQTGTCSITGGCAAQSEYQ